MTATAAPWTAPPPVDQSPAPVDPIAYAALAVVTNLIELGAATAPRSVQLTIGSSEIGYECPRRIAYRAAGVPATNLRDPLRSLVGLGMHEAMAELFRRLDARSGRFLVEFPVTYRGVPGTVDLYDRWTHRVIDWKTSTKSKIRHLRQVGPPPASRVQVQVYGAALAELGETPREVALVYLPLDGELDQTWAWVRAADPLIANEAIDRLDRLREQPPADVDAKPDRLCPWCSHYRPGSTDLTVGCPGRNGDPA